MPILTVVSKLPTDFCHRFTKYANVTSFRTTISSSATFLPHSSGSIDEQCEPPGGHVQQVGFWKSFYRTAKPELNLVLWATPIRALAGPPFYSAFPESIDRTGEMMVGCKCAWRPTGYRKVPSRPRCGSEAAVTSIVSAVDQLLGAAVHDIGQRADDEQTEHGCRLHLASRRVVPDASGESSEASANARHSPILRARGRLNPARLK